MLIVEIIEDELGLRVGLMRPNKRLIDVAHATGVVSPPVVQSVHVLAPGECFVHHRPLTDLAPVAAGYCIDVIVNDLHQLIGSIIAVFEPIRQPLFLAP